MELKGAEHRLQIGVERPLGIDLVAVGAEQGARPGDLGAAAAERQALVAVIERCRADPATDPFAGEPRPVEFLARIDLAPRRHVGVGEHTLGRDGVPPRDVTGERRHRPHLGAGKVGIAEHVSRVLDLDPDRCRVDVGLPCPVGNARMPGTHVLGHHLRDATAVVDHVVARDLARRPRQDLDRTRDGGQSRVVQDQDRGRVAGLARLDVGRGVEIRDQDAVGPRDEIEAHALSPCTRRPFVSAS